MSKRSGLYLDHELGEVPPSVPTLPVRTLSRCRVLLTCHPPRFPMAAALHTWVASLLPALATISPTSITCSTGILHSFAANSGVYCEYSSIRSSMKRSNSRGSAGWSASNHSSQFTQFSTKSLSNSPRSRIIFAHVRKRADSDPGQVGSQ